MPWKGGGLRVENKVGSGTCQWVPSQGGIAAETAIFHCQDQGRWEKTAERDGTMGASSWEGGRTQGGQEGTESEEGEVAKPMLTRTISPSPSIPEPPSRFRGLPD